MISEVRHKANRHCLRRAWQNKTLTKTLKWYLLVEVQFCQKTNALQSLSTSKLGQSGLCSSHNLIIPCTHKNAGDRSFSIAGPDAGKAGDRSFSIAGLDAGINYQLTVKFINSLQTLKFKLYTFLSVLSFHKSWAFCSILCALSLVNIRFINLTFSS